MKKIILFCSGLSVFLLCLVLLFYSNSVINFSKTKEKKGFEVIHKMNMPNDYFYRQRAYPYQEINAEVYQKAIQQVRFAKEKAKKYNEAWESVGPTNVGGRITDVALHPTNKNIIYVGASVGGVWKSVDGGDTWQAIFDNVGSLSIGNLAIDPQNPDVLYVGTGEANGSATSGAFFGDGLYKTTDGGETWKHIGLEKSQHIGRIVVDPNDSQKIWVAAAGNLYSTNPERGVYQSDDGGETWQQSLYISDSTACIDLVVHPDSSHIIYAAMWERVRHVWGRVYGGQTSGIYRSKDGGKNWVQLKNGLPQSDTQTGRIGLAIAKSRPDILYAAYSTDSVHNYFDGIYKTANGGDSWQEVNNEPLGNLYASFGWFFGNLRVDPTDYNTVYAMGLNIFKSSNGGQNWTLTSSNIHVDQHALEVHPLDADFLVTGNDGGVYISKDGGSTWSHSQLPLTQFYACEVDEQFPERRYGGTQDNGTNRTLTGATDDWKNILGGDGFVALVDPTDTLFVYAEAQWGNLFRSVNGGSNFSSAQSGINSSDRKNWHTPYVFAPSDPSILYYGTHRLYKSTNRAVNWQPISTDLTKGEHESGSTAFATITTITVAPSDGDVIYVGTDDGNVQLTKDGGETWTLIVEDLPNRWVSGIAVDYEEPDVAYVTFSGYRYNDYLSHIFRTDDAGLNWVDISGNLPEVPINDVIIEPTDAHTLYIANDLGVWVSNDLGDSWQVLGDKLPMVPVNDLRLHNDTRTLLAATFGRSMYTYNLNTPVPPPPTSTTENIAPLSTLTINPNPARTAQNIQLEFTLKKPQYGSVELYDLSGKKVQIIVEQQFKAGVNQFSKIIPNLVSGTYIIRLHTSEVLLASKLVIK